MPSGAIAVAAVSVQTKNSAVVRLTQPALATEPVDPFDCLNPQNWIVTGPMYQNTSFSAFVADVLSADSSTLTPASLLVFFDTELLDGGAYTISLGPFAQAANGNNSDPSVAVPFRVPPHAPLGPKQSVGVLPSDIVSPPSAGIRGDFALLSRLDSLKERILLRAYVRIGSFAHLPDFGRAVEPNRNYSDQKIVSAASLLKSDILKDADVKDCSIRVDREGHAITFNVGVQPSFSPQQLVVPIVIVAGSSP